MTRANQTKPYGWHSLEYFARGSKKGQMILLRSEMCEHPDHRCSVPAPAPVRGYPALQGKAIPDHGDFLESDTFSPDYLLQHGLRVHNKAMRKLPGPAIGQALSRSEILGQFSSACNASWHSCQSRSDHSWHVAVKAVGLDDIGRPLGDRTCQAGQTKRRSRRLKTHRWHRPHRDS